MANMGMTQMPAPYPAYHQVPTIAFEDLMNAPGWDMPFTVPMEENAWVFDANTGYTGMSIPSPPSDGTWGSSPRGLQ